MRIVRADCDAIWRASHFHLHPLQWLQRIYSKPHASCFSLCQEAGELADTLILTRSAPGADVVGFGAREGDKPRRLLDLGGRPGLPIFLRMFYLCEGETGIHAGLQHPMQLNGRLISKRLCHQEKTSPQHQMGEKHHCFAPPLAIGLRRSVRKFLWCFLAMTCKAVCQTRRLGSSYSNGNRLRRQQGRMWLSAKKERQPTEMKVVPAENWNVPCPCASRHTVAGRTTQCTHTRAY